MITTDEAYVRSTDPDDASTLIQLYAWDKPCCALLDKRREPLLPTVDELREILASPEAVKGAFHTLEDGTGQIRGFCCLRGLSQELSFCDISVLPLEVGHLSFPCLEAGMQFVMARAFEHYGVQKAMTHILSHESELRAFYERHGFQSAGVQREALFTQGRYHDIEALVCWNPAGTRRVLQEGP